MKNPKNLALISVCALILSNCASQPKEFVSLPEKIQKEIASTEAYIEECEQKMQADVESSNLTAYSGGGLLVALVDCAIMSHRESCANDAMADMQKEVQAFNFQEKFRNRLVHTLQNTNWLHVRQINYLRGTLGPKSYEEIFKKENNDVVLTAGFKYKLNPELNVLRGTLYLAFYPSSNKLKKMVNTEEPLNTPLFKFHVSAAEALPQAGKDIQENASLWAQNNGLHLKKALDNIIHRVFIDLDKILKDPSHLPEN